MDDDQPEKLRRDQMVAMIARERSLQFQSFMTRWRFGSWDDVLSIINTCIWNPKVQATLMAAARKALQLGILPYECEGLDWGLRQAVADTFKTVDPSSGISGVASMVVGLSGTDIPTWRVFNPDILIERFVHDGGFGLCNGSPRAGKTNSMVVLIECFIKYGGVVISNIRPIGDAAWTYARSLTQLLQAYMLIDGDKQVLFVLDEGGLILDRKEAMAKRVREMEHFFRIAAKLRIGFIMIEQREQSVPKILEDWTTFRLFAHHPGIISLELKNEGGVYFNQRIRGFPKAEHYDTRDIAWFKVDVNIAKLLEHLSETASSSTHKAEIKAFLSIKVPEKIKGKRSSKSLTLNTVEETDADPDAGAA